MTFTCTGVIILVWGQLTCTLPQQPVTDTFCTSYVPVRWASADTRETKEQVDQNNRRWKRRCRK
jgi:hypothetical protein